MTFLSSLLASIIVPILDERLKALEAKVESAFGRLDIYKKHDQEADALIEAANRATTTEEVKAHVRRLKSLRAQLKS
jgi:hypothetical protein